MGLLLGDTVTAGWGVWGGAAGAAGRDGRQQALVVLRVACCQGRSP